MKYNIECFSFGSVSGANPNPPSKDNSLGDKIIPESPSIINKLTIVVPSLFLFSLI